MSTVEQIEAAISELSRADLELLRAWFEEFDAEMWDLQFEQDASAGKLDAVAEQAIGDFRSGNYKEL